MGGRRLHSSLAAESNSRSSCHVGASRVAKYGAFADAAVATFDFTNVLILERSSLKLDFCVDAFCVGEPRLLPAAFAEQLKLLNHIANLRAPLKVHP